ncbi:MAG: MBL fold metallo-hydrolase [Clostridiales bacterium]|nr:MBL fold metallo-hydrolase [Clostridiales bacterium]
MKRFLNTIIAAVAAVSLIGCGLSAARGENRGVPETAEGNITAEEGAPEPEKLTDLSVYCFKIGKADSFVLQTENSVVVIDTGEEEDDEEIIEYLEDNNITDIDYLIISHFDKDHVGGAADIINNFNIEHILQPNASEESDEYYNYVSAVKSSGISPEVITDTYTFSLDGANFIVLPPLSASYKEDKDNNSSLVVSISHGENSFLFTGDAMDERITELLTYDNLEHTVLKMPHHGGYSDKLADLVEAVSPEYAIITCSDKNPEDEETLEILENAGAEVYLTRNGDISITSDGENLTFKQ